MPDLFSIDGRVYNLPILEYEIDTQILDGGATGRSQADKWPLFRQPQGVIVNIERIEFGLLSDNARDFRDLIQTLRSFGDTDFRIVRFVTQVDEIEQPMYGASFRQQLRHFNYKGVSYWGNLTAKFVAKQGI